MSSTPYRAHFAHAIFSRVLLKTELQGSRLSPRLSVKQMVCPFKRSCLSFSRIMSHSHSSLLDLSLFFSSTILISLLLPSQGDHRPPDPRKAGLCGDTKSAHTSHRAMDATPPLTDAETTLHRSCVGALVYYGLDRADAQLEVSSLGSHLRAPTTGKHCAERHDTC